MNAYTTANHNAGYDSISAPDAENELRQGPSWLQVNGFGAPD